jgi:hypothetical protein
MIPLNIGGDERRPDRERQMSISDERSELCFLCCLFVVRDCAMELQKRKMMLG